MFRFRRNAQYRDSVGVSVCAGRCWAAWWEALSGEWTSMSGCTWRRETLTDSRSRSDVETESGSMKFRSIGVTRLRRTESPAESRIIATTFSCRAHLTSTSPTLTMKSPTPTPASCNTKATYYTTYNTWRNARSNGKSDLPRASFPSFRWPALMGFWCLFCCPATFFVWSVLLATKRRSILLLLLLQNVFEPQTHQVLLIKQLWLIWFVFIYCKFICFSHPATFCQKTWISAQSITVPIEMTLRLLSQPGAWTEPNKKLSYRRETARQLHTSFSAHSLIVHVTEHRICFTTI